MSAILPFAVPRGNTAKVAAYTGPAGSLVYNTDIKALYLQDGTTAGGFALSKVGHQHTQNEVIAFLGYTPINAAIVGQASGVAPLGSDGKVPAQYISGGGGGASDVLEGTGTLARNTAASAVWAGVDAGSDPVISLFNFSAPNNNRWSHVYVTDAGNVRWTLGNDAISNDTPFLLVTRSGNTAATLNLAATALSLTGSTVNLAASAGLLLNGAVGTAGQVLQSNGVDAAPTWETPTGGGGTTLAATGTNPRTTTVTGLYGGTNSGQATLAFGNSTASSGNRAIQFYQTNAGSFYGLLLDDAFSTNTAFLEITRSANVATQITLTSTAFNLAVGTGGLKLNGAAGTAGQVLTSNGAAAAPTWSTPTAVAASLYATAGPSTVNTANAISVGAYGSGGLMYFISSAAGTDQKMFALVQDANGLYFRLPNDAGAGASTAISMLRSGTTSTNVILTGTVITLAGAATAPSLALTGSTAPANGLYLPAANTVGISTNSTAGLFVNAVGALGLAGANYGTAGQVLQSNGAGAAPTWATNAGASTLSATGALPLSTAVSAVFVGVTASGSNPAMNWIHAGAATNSKLMYQRYLSTGVFEMGWGNDAGASPTPYFSATRTAAANTNAALALTGTLINLAVGTGGLQLNGAAGTAGQVLTSNGNAAAPTWTAPSVTQLSGTTAPAISTAANALYAGANGSNPFINFVNAGAPLNEKVWSLYTGNDGTFILKTQQDASAAGALPMTIAREGTVVSTMTLTMGNFVFAGQSLGATLAGGNTSITTAPGGSTSGAGGNLTMVAGNAGGGGVGGNTIIRSGNGIAAGAGGSIQLLAGTSGATSGAGGLIQITSGMSGTAGAASGAVTIGSGNGFANNGVSGTVSITTGNCTGAIPGTMNISTGTTASANGGPLNVFTGSVATSGTSGAINIYTGTGATAAGTLSLRTGGNGGTGMQIDAPGNFYPTANGTQNLGGASNRFNNSYFAVASTIGSDANYKQDILPLEEAELAVARKIKTLFKKYRLKDAVASKGSAARIHVGVIAQEVKAAFEEQSLVAENYALFCSDTWYEVNGSAQNADGVSYTAATEGATQVNRLSIRYEELLAFVIAAM